MGMPEGKCSCNHAESGHEPLTTFHPEDDQHGGGCRHCECGRFTWVGMYTVDAASQPEDAENPQE